jgi:hypothetical protein
LVGMAVNPMITLVHKKADFDGMWYISSSLLV